MFEIWGEKLGEIQDIWTFSQNKKQFSALARVKDENMRQRKEETSINTNSLSIVTEQ